MHKLYLIKSFCETRPFNTTIGRRKIGKIISEVYNLYYILWLLCLQTLPTFGLSVGREIFQKTLSRIIGKLKLSNLNVHADDTLIIGKQ